MLTLLISVHIIVAVLIIVVVLLQQGKGANMGASFGAGSSQTVFGSRGAAPFLFKLTAFLVALFFITSIGLSYVGKHAAASSATNATAGLSQADYQKQQSAQQALLNAAKSQGATPDNVNNKQQVPDVSTPSSATPQPDHKLKIPSHPSNKTEN